MESMLAEQNYLRSPLRQFSDLDPRNNNLSLEDKAFLAARSQLFLRAAAAAAGPYAPLMSPVWAGSPSSSMPSIPPLWSQWACLGPSLLAAQQQHFAAAVAASSSSHSLSLPRIICPTASTSIPPRFSPYSPSPPARRSPSSPESCSERPPSSPHPT